MTEHYSLKLPILNDFFEINDLLMIFRRHPANAIMILGYPNQTEREQPNYIEMPSFFEDIDGEHLWIRFCYTNNDFNYAINELERESCKRLHNGVVDSFQLNPPFIPPEIGTIIIDNIQKCSIEEMRDAYRQIINLNNQI